MKAGDIYYNPKTNQLIELNQDPILFMDVLEIVGINDSIGYVKIDEETYSYPTGPLFGKTTKEIRTEFRKIGKL